MTKKNSGFQLNYNIFIPTYNRPEYLRRILSYYDSYYQPFKIIIADSSPNDIKKINQKIISSFSHIQIKNLYNYPSNLNPHHKFADMVKYTDQPYCVICPDDDFIVPHGIERSIKFLEKNSDFTCAHGKYMSFKYNIEKKEFYWQMIYPYKSIESDYAKERFFSHLTEYYQTLYAVHRTGFMQMIYQELLISKVDPMQFGELLPDMLSLIYGKMKGLDVLYSVRQAESRVAYWPTLFEYMETGKYDKEYLKFKNCLAIHLSKNSKLNEEEAKILINNAMEQYLKKTRKNDSVENISNIMKKIHLPSKFDEIFRNLYRKFASEYDYNPWITVNPPMEYIEDFNRIRNHVLSYSKK